MNDTIQSAQVSAFTIPTATPESDGTAEWSATTLVLVEVEAQNVVGLGYSYANACCLPLIRETLFPILLQKNPLSIPSLWHEMNVAVRNLGRSGIASCAIAAVEMALWDLKGRLLKCSLLDLLGAARK